MSRSSSSPPFRISVLVLGGALFAFLLAEVAMRLFLPFDFHRRHYSRAVDLFHCLPNTHRFDPEIGFLPAPNLDTVYETPDFRSRIRTNSFGFRDDEASMKDPEVVFLGDSFGFGWGVEDEETCANVFESITGIRTLNLGVVGTNTIQQYLLLKRYADPLGLRGKTVVFLFFPNDIWGNVSVIEGLFPTLRKEGRRVSITPVTQEAFETWIVPAPYPRVRALGGWSYTVEFLAALAVEAQSREKMSRWLVDHPLDLSLGHAVHPHESLEYILRMIRAFAESWDLNLLLVHSPGVEYYEKGKEKDYYPLFERITSDLELVTLDLTEVLTREDYFPHDVHWGPSAHRKAARAIAEYLREIDSGLPESKQLGYR